MTIVFRAMNTDVTVLVPEVDAFRERELAQLVEELFARTERTFSRFRGDSELSRLNRSDGPMVVSAEMFHALERARSYWERTDGWFDPTIALALAAAGYDRSFAPGALDRSGAAIGQNKRASFEGVVLDVASRTVSLPSGTAVDCGGFVKGWTVDRAIELLPTPCAVDAGGDADLRGLGPDGAGWLVGVEDPARPGSALLEFYAQDRGVATSGPGRRHWRVGEREAHHLIDPHSGEPAASDLAQVTVVAPNAELADVLAKTVYLRGFDDGRRFLERFPDVSAIFVLRTGDVRISGKLEANELMSKHTKSA
jgi:thiamine biosynthesis lipoprotein